MADQEINIKLNGIAQIKKELRELKGELASATDPTQMAELANKAGVLSDQLKDANERVAVFASGSPFEQTNNALGLMGSQLMSLDFEGAAESAKLFASAAKGINPGQMATQLKSLGSVVFDVGKAFMSIGASLLMNPIFLIAAAVIAIVAVIALLMNKLGLLQPIIDAISAAFGAMMAVVDAVIQGLRDFTDWLGLTANAAEDSAERQIAASEKTLEVLTRTSEKNIDSMDHEIALAKIQGKEVAVSEAEKQKYIIQTTQIRIDELAKQIAIHQQLGDLEDEDLNKLKDSLAEQKKALREASQEFEIIREQNKAKVAANAQKVADNEKKINEQRRKTAEENAAIRLAADKMIEDLRIQNMAEGTEKELAALNLKYKRLQEANAQNLKITEAQRKAIDDQLSAARFNEQIEILKTESDKIQETVNQAAANRSQKKKEEDAKDLEKQKAFSELKRTTGKTQLELDLMALNEEYTAKRELAGTDMQLQAQLTQEFEDKKAAIEKKAADEKRERDKAIASAALDVTRSGLQGASDLVNAFAGKSLAAQKKAFETTKKLNIAMAVIDTIKGAVSAFTGMTSTIPGPVGIALGAIAAAGVVASGVANVKKIKDTKFEGGGSASASTGASVASGASSTQQMQPQLFGQNNNQNNLSSTPSVEKPNNNMTVTAVVVESEVTATQAKVKGIQNGATL